MGERQQPTTQQHNSSIEYNIIIHPYLKFFDLFRRYFLLNGHYHPKIIKDTAVKKRFIG